MHSRINPLEIAMTSATACSILLRSVPRVACRSRLPPSPLCGIGGPISSSPYVPASFCATHPQRRGVHSREQGGVYECESRRVCENDETINGTNSLNNRSLFQTGVLGGRRSFVTSSGVNRGGEDGLTGTVSFFSDDWFFMRVMVWVWVKSLE